VQASAEVFYQAATLMVVGMCFVFAFLGMLIVAIKTLIAPLASRYPDPIPESKLSDANTSQQQPTAVVAAISAAITQYRSMRTKTE